MSGENIKTKNIGLVLTNDEYTLFKNWWRIQNGIGEGTDTSPLSNAQIIDEEFGKVDNKFTEVDNKFTEISGNFDDVWTKFLDYYTKAEVDQKIAKAASAALRLTVVEELPDVPAQGEENFIYLVPKQDAAEKNIYEEYVWALIDTETGEKNWELIGTTEVDLTNYVTNDELASQLSPINDRISTVESSIETKQSFPLIPDLNVPLELQKQIFSPEDLTDDLLSLDTDILGTLIGDTLDTKYYMDNFGNTWSVEPTPSASEWILSANISIIVGNKKYLSSYKVITDIDSETGGSHVEVGDVTVTKFVDENELNTKQDVPTFGEDNLSLIIPVPVFSEQTLGVTVESWDGDFAKAMITLAAESPNNTIQYIDNFGEVWCIESTAEDSANIVLIVGDIKYISSYEVVTDTETGSSYVLIGEISIEHLSTGGSVDLDYATEDDVYKAMGIINLDNEEIEDTTFILGDTDIVDENNNMAILGEEE